MSQKANPLQRLLLWLSGAPAPSSSQPQQSSGAELPAQPAAAHVATPQPPEEIEFETPALIQPADAAAQPEASTMNNVPVNDAGAYGVLVVPADIPEGTRYWQVIRVHHLTPDENQGRHHLFLDALDEAGQRSFGAQARVTWPGGEQIITVEKPVGEPGANFPMWKWQVCAVEMLGLPSDRVENLHTGHPDEPPGLGNTLFHHSFEVVFQQAVKSAAEPPPDDKVIDRYVLFGPADAPRTAVYVELARGYLLSRQPTFGFDPRAASHGREVIMVGGLQDIGQEIEDALRQAGCQVRRVQGTPEEVAAAFRGLQSGQVFLPMTPVS